MIPPLVMMLLIAVPFSTPLPLTTPVNCRVANNLYNLDIDGSRSYCPNINTTMQLVAPMQMSSADGNFQISYSQSQALNIMLDEINTKKCGVFAAKDEGKEKVPMFMEVLGIADEKSRAKAAKIVSITAEVNTNASQP
jgi:hypothetical protein